MVLRLHDCGEMELVAGAGKASSRTAGPILLICMAPLRFLPQLNRRPRGDGSGIALAAHRERSLANHGPEKSR
jgi:hypothetical protein